MKEGKPGADCPYHLLRPSCAGTVLPNAPGSVSEGTSCPVPKGLGNELVLLQGR